MIVGCVSQWLERLPDIRLAWVREPAMAEKHLHQCPFIFSIAPILWWWGVGRYLESNTFGGIELPLYSGDKVWEGIWNQAHLVVFLLPLYSGDKVWEGIWNQAHLVVLNFCLESLPS